MVSCEDNLATVATQLQYVQLARYHYFVPVSVHIIENLVNT